MFRQALRCSPPAVFDKSGQLWILGCLQDFPRKKIAPIKGHFPGDPFGGFGGSPLQQESDDVQPGSRIDLVFTVAREQVPEEMANAVDQNPQVPDVLPVLLMSCRFSWQTVELSSSFGTKRDTGSMTRRVRPFASIWIARLSRF